MKKSLILFVTAMAPLAMFAQEAAASMEAEAPQVSRNVGDYFGMTDMGLFSLMTTIIILLSVGVAVNYYLFQSLIKNERFRDFVVNRKGTGSSAKSILMFLFLSGASATAMAAEAGASEGPVKIVTMTWMEFYVMTGLIAVLATQYIYYSYLLLRLFRIMRPKKQVAKKRVDLFVRIEKMLTKTVPVDQEEDILLDHEYDGIQELDNSLPPWWKWGFYISIIWAIGYLGYYHVFDMGELQEEEFAREWAEGEAEVEAYLASLANAVDETNAEQIMDASRLAAGEALFNKHCVVCHGTEGQGDTGPNLTDEHWLYGGNIKDVFATVKYGADNGMKSWKDDLTPFQIHEVASYVKTLEYISPAEGGKEPQGDLYEEVEEENPAETEEETVETASM